MTKAELKRRAKGKMDLLQEENEELKRIIEAYKNSVHDLVSGYGHLIEKKNKEIFDLRDEIYFLNMEIKSFYDQNGDQSGSKS